MLFDRDFIGVYQKGEVPTTPLQYQFKDADNVALDITGHAAATFLHRTPAGVEVSTAATIVSAWNGVVAVAWTSAMTATSGVWRGIFWLDNAVASDTLVWTVVDGPGPTV